VEDIDVVYKMFGKGEPLILFNGASDSMDGWDPSFLTGISNHTVIVLDRRGIENTTRKYDKLYQTIFDAATSKRYSWFT
jgi:pimeloyl-ACP methyl ester carboxylesterase